MAGRNSATAASVQTGQQRAWTTLQGIPVPADAINPPLFMQLTRRSTVPEKSINYAGLGNTDTFELRKADIVGNIRIKFSGTLTLAVGTGTIATTAAWPYGLIARCRFTANNMSNLVNAGGIWLKVREFITNLGLNDRGVSRTVGGAAVTQGTLSLASENWQVGSNTTGITGTGGPVELEWVVPVLDDPLDLYGAILAANSTTDLTLTLDYETLANLFVLTGNATATLTGTVTIQPERYTIPQPNGTPILPDLSVFHSFVTNRVAAGIGNGAQELRLVGQGAGKRMTRVLMRTLNGATPAPLVVNATNYGEIHWAYGANEIPESYVDGQAIRELNERQYGEDVGAVWGFLAHEFGDTNLTAAARDSVDQGTIGDLRVGFTIQNGVSLTNAAVEYAVDAVIRAGAAA